MKYETVIRLITRCGECSNADTHIPEGTNEVGFMFCDHAELKDISIKKRKVQFDTLPNWCRLEDFKENKK